MTQQFSQSPLGAGEYITGDPPEEEKFQSLFMFLFLC